MERAFTYRPRIIDEILDRYQSAFSAVALQGAKGVGKTATARRRASSVFKLDEPEQLQVVTADLNLAMSAAPPVLFDEWQRYPPVWDAVRNADDVGAAPASYLLTGSADPRDAPAHTGAGRIVTVRLRPMSLYERLGEASVSLRALLDGEAETVQGETDLGLEFYTHEIIQSGFPGIRRYRGSLLRDQLESYLTLIVEKDFSALGQQVRNPQALRRWMAAYAAASSTTASFEAIRAAATSNQSEKPARSTAIPYRDALRRLFITDPVPAWRPQNNPLGELGDSEKHQLADPALAARLVRASASRLLEGRGSGPNVRLGRTGARDGVRLGALFESLVTLSVRVYAQAAESAEPEVRHLRMHRGDHEIDLIVEREDGAVLAIEVKLTAVPDDDDVRHLHWLKERLGDQMIDGVLINTGRFAYRRPDGIAVIPAALLGP